MFTVHRYMRRAVSLGTIGLLAGGFMTVNAIGSHAEDVTCFGKSATIVGTDGSEFINGTEGDDVMAGLAGKDTLQAGPGNDLVCGGDGDDELFGETGTDALDGGEGKDICNYTNGDAQAEGDEKYVSCETSKSPRATSPGDDPEPEAILPGTPLPYPIGDGGKK